MYPRLVRALDSLLVKFVYVSPFALFGLLSDDYVMVGGASLLLFVFDLRG